MLGRALVNFHLGLSHFRLNHKGKSRSWLLNREPSETSAFHQSFPWGTEKWQTRLCSLGSSHRCRLLGAGLMQWLMSARQEEEQMMLRKILPLAFLHNPCQPVGPPWPSCYQGNTALILAERTLPSSAFQETAISHPHIRCGLTVHLFPTGHFPEPSNTTKKPPPCFFFFFLTYCIVISTFLKSFSFCLKDFFKAFFKGKSTGNRFS